MPDLLVHFVHCSVYCYMQAAIADITKFYVKCSTTVYPFSVYIGFCQNKGFWPGMKAIVRFDEFVSTPAEFIGMYVTVVLVCNSKPSIGPNSFNLKTTMHES